MRFRPIQCDWKQISNNNQKHHQSIAGTTWFGRTITLMCCNQKSSASTWDLNRNSVIKYLNHNRLENQQELNPGWLGGWLGGSSHLEIQERYTAVVTRLQETHTQQQWDEYAAQSQRGNPGWRRYIGKTFPSSKDSDHKAKSHRTRAPLGAYGTVLCTDRRAGGDLAQ